MKLIDVLNARSDGDGVEALRIERQHVLQPLQRVERDEAGDRKGDHRDRIDEPALLALLVDAGEAIEAALDRPQDGREEIVACPRRCCDDEPLSGMAVASTSARTIAICDQPTIVMASPSGLKRSEFLGMDQRVKQIGAEAEADDQADDGFDHGELRASQAVAGDGVERHQREEHEAAGEIDDVEHGKTLQVAARLCAARRKVPFRFARPI